MGSDTEISTKNANIDTKRHVCPYDGCFAAFHRPSKLERHIRTHTKERPFKCDYPDCSKTYTNNSHLRRHILTTHKKTDLPIVELPCPYMGCYRIYRNKYSLKKHCKSHQSPTYSCPDCGENFKKKFQLESHSSSHHASSIVSCVHCDSKFVSQKDLTQHMKRHRVYVCEYEDCKEEFMMWSLLRKHFKFKHKRLYECDFCKRTFINKNTMMKHIITHLNISDPEVYVCTYKGCNRFYKYKRNLSQHIRTSHEGKRYKCTEEDCTQVFLSKNRLQDHIKRHKNGTLRIIKPKKVKKPKKKEKFVKHSQAALLSGVELVPLSQSEGQEDVQYTIRVLEEEPEEESHDDEPVNVQRIDSLNSVMLFVTNKTLENL